MSRQSAGDPYERLLALANEELEHAGRGEYDRLADLYRRRAAIIAGLPARPPASAIPTLQRTALIQERVTIELMRGREEKLFLLRRIVQARRAARGYRRSVARRAAATRIDTRA